jgi:hypothetical protein
MIYFQKDIFCLRICVAQKSKKNDEEWTNTGMWINGGSIYTLSTVHPLELPKFCAAQEYPAVRIPAQSPFLAPMLYSFWPAARHCFH